MIDLQAIDTLYESKNQEEWSVVSGRECAGITSLTEDVVAYGEIFADDAKLIVALHNTWPQIREELLRGRKLRKMLENVDDKHPRFRWWEQLAVAIREYEEGV